MTANTYITLPEASRKYKVPRYNLAEIANNIWFQGKRKGAVINTNIGGKRAKYAFHEATLVEFLTVDSTATAIKRHKANI